MQVLIYLIPVALLMGFIGLLAFLWTLKSGQYDDLDGAALRILDDSDIEEVKHYSDDDTKHREDNTNINDTNVD